VRVKNPIERLERGGRDTVDLRKVSTQRGISEGEVVDDVGGGGLKGAIATSAKQVLPHSKSRGRELVKERGLKSDRKKKKNRPVLNCMAWTGELRMGRDGDSTSKRRELSGHINEE